MGATDLLGQKIGGGLSESHIGLVQHSYSLRARVPVNRPPTRGTTSKSNPCS